MDSSNHHIKKYIEYHDKYTKKYGENTVVLMQSGSHFNIFSIINDTVSIGPDIYHICQNILGNALQVTKQNKKNPEISFSNCLLAGFPIYVIQKYENILLNNNFTVVIVEQITPPPNPERGVTRIVSPGTSIEGYNKNDNHYLMSVYIEKNEYMNKDVFISGLSVIDLSTGKNHLHYIISKIDDNEMWIDEIGKYIHFYNPSEILFHFKNITLSHNDIIQKWDISHNSIQINHYDDKNYLKTTYQNEFLQKIFNLNVMMTPIEHFDLETKPELVISYVFMLHYINDHIAETLQNIELPEYIGDDKCLCITSNSIRQLNVINNYSYFKGKNESLLSVCNLCVTPMGRRLFKERLLYPSIEPDVIKSRYDSIDLFRNENYYEKVHKILRKVSDLEKSLRKMGLNLTQPSDFFSDTLSFDYIEQLLVLLKEEDKIISRYDKLVVQSFSDFYNECKRVFVFHNLSQSGNLEKSILQSELNADLDSYDKLTAEYHQTLEVIAIRLSKLLDGSETSVKLDFDERNEWFFYCTNKRAITFKERVKNLGKTKIHVHGSETPLSFGTEDFSYKKKDGSSTIIQFGICSNISKKLIKIQSFIKKLNKEEWGKRIDSLYRRYNTLLKRFYHILSEIDVYSSGAKLSIQNGYYRPELKDADKSFIECKEIRHPIVEKIHTETEYVTNDIDLGIINEKDGILLFGTNACGKSTLMKSIGLNLIMAQAGLFVAAKEFVFKPYTQIFTRILNNDNIFRSQSSFAVEIQELKSILKRADKDSLVLGDELCSGTESISAMAIIATGLKELCERKTSFIFTSHLHQLTELDEIKQLNNLEIYHLKINYDRSTNTLIYDRKLEKGSGPPIYGLKVCEAMGLSKDFISYAKRIQKNIECKGFHNSKQSQYNPNVFMDECKICSSQGELETHHIKDQKYSDENKMIHHHHQNIQHNLVPLCKVCHLKVTLGEIIVVRWEETSHGKKLIWKTAEKKTKSKKKFGEKDILKIKEIYNENSKLSKKDILKHYELSYQMKLSQSTLKKIMENTY
jgi:DNA mismatch repair protein MutS